MSGTVTQASGESNGTTTPGVAGQYTYTFKTKAPAGFDATVTHTIGIYGSRDLTVFNLGTNYASATFNFVPNGAAVTVTRDVIRTESCNTCHDQLSFHGGSRRGMEMCVLCHTPQTVDPDTGNTLDLKVMAHKIHMGSQLPSVIAGTPYQIIGFQNAVSDFSTVIDPADPRRCEVCHNQTTGAAQAKVFMTEPTRAACGACHDDVNFATGANHPGGFQMDDNQCANCHIPHGETPFDASILGAHVVPTDTAALYPQNPNTLLAGIKVAITGVTNNTAGQGAHGGLHAAGRQRQRDTAYRRPPRFSSPCPVPATDYGLTNFGSDTTSTPGYVTESATTGDLRFQRQLLLHVHARDSGRRHRHLRHRRGSPPVGDGTGRHQRAADRLGRRHQSGGELLGGRLDGPTAPHGGGAWQLQQLPRRPLATWRTAQPDRDVRAVPQSVQHRFHATPNATVVASDKTEPPQGINFALMVHRIHDGVNVTANGGKPYIIVGFRGSHNDFSDVLFPAMSPTGEATDLQNCSMCHANGSEQNLPIGLNPVTDPQG